MRKNGVFRLLGRRKRRAIVRRLLVAYKHDDAERMTTAVAELASAYGARMPRVKFVKAETLKGAFGDTLVNTGTIRLIRPSEWAVGRRGRFAHALEWAKTVIHECLHAFVIQHEEEHVRAWEKEFVADLKFTGKEIEEGLDN